MVIPSEFTQLLDSDEVSLECIFDANGNPSLLIEPANEPDTIDDDPLFSVFLKAIYKDVIENPHTLQDGSALFNERVLQLIEDVDIDGDE